MRKILHVLLIIVCIVCTVHSVKAQIDERSVLKIGTLARKDLSISPLQPSGSPGWNRSLFIYPIDLILPTIQKDYAKAGKMDDYKKTVELMKSRDGGFYMTSIAFNRLSSEAGFTPNTSRVRIYLKNTSRLSFGGSASWKKEINDAYLVYDGDPALCVGNSNGFKTFKFMTPFLYTGQEIEFMFEIYKSAVSGPIEWSVSGNSEVAVYTKDMGLYATATDGSFPPDDNTFNNGTDIHPDLQLGFTTSLPNKYISVGSGMMSESDEVPIRKGATGWNRNVYIYPWTMLSGLKEGSSINAFEMYRLNDGNTIGAGNELKIYIKNSTDYSFGGAADWNVETGSAILVYDGDPQPIVGNSSGYKRFIFMNPFMYSGDNLEIMFEYTKTSDNGGNDEIDWAKSDLTTDRSLDGSQGMKMIMMDGSLPDPNKTVFANNTEGIPNLRVVLTQPDASSSSASNGLVVNNGNRKYYINTAITDVMGSNSTDDQNVNANSNMYANNYLLLHPLVTPKNFIKDQNGLSNFSESYVFGKISARRGSGNNYNRKINIDVNTSTSYNRNLGSLICYNEPVRLVTLRYNNIDYLAIELPINGSLYDFSFTGYSENAVLQLVTGNDLGNVDIKSVQKYMDVDDVAESSLDAITTQGALHAGQEIEINNMATANNLAVDAHLMLSSSDNTLTNKYIWQLNTSSDQGSSGITPNGFDIWEYPSNGNTFSRLSILPTGNSVIANGNTPNPVLIKPDGSMAIGFPPVDRTVAGGYNVNNDLALNSTYTLTVNGVVGSKKVKVTQSGWPDYVFDSAYKLMPLENVETYIKKNKHLSDVPAAAEMGKEGGLDLGDNQAVLMKKVEELTLYIINQQKQIQELTKKVDELQKNK